MSDLTREGIARAARECARKSLVDIAWMPSWSEARESHLAACFERILLSLAPEPVPAGRGEEEFIEHLLDAAQFCGIDMACSDKEREGIVREARDEVRPLLRAFLSARDAAMAEECAKVCEEVAVSFGRQVELAKQGQRLNDVRALAVNECASALRARAKGT